jgi:hypothetical protein
MSSRPQPATGIINMDVGRAKKRRRKKSVTWASSLEHVREYDPLDDEDPAPIAPPKQSAMDARSGFNFSSLVESSSASIPLFNIPGGAGGRDKRDLDKFNLPKPNSGLAAAAIEHGYVRRKKEVDAIEKKKVDALERKRKEDAVDKKRQEDTLEKNRQEDAQLAAAVSVGSQESQDESPWKDCVDQVSNQLHRSERMCAPELSHDVLSHKSFTT